MTRTGDAPAGLPGRVLLLADVDAAGPDLMLEIMEKATPAGLEVLVVAPAIVDPEHFWASDIDTARRDARGRLGRTIESLSFRGSRWRGLVGDEDPLQAVDDAVREFPADEIIVVTAEADRAPWLEDGLVGQIAARHPIPVTHFTAVDGEPAHAATRRVEPDRPTGGHWRWLVLGVVLVLAVLGTWASFLLAGTDLPRPALVAWVILLDVGFKVVVLPLTVWWLFFRRPRGDRLDL